MAAQATAPDIGDEAAAVAAFETVAKATPALAEEPALIVEEPQTPEIAASGVASELSDAVLGTSSEQAHAVAQAVQAVEPEAAQMQMTDAFAPIAAETARDYASDEPLPPTGDETRDLVTEPSDATIPIAESSATQARSIVEEPRSASAPNVEAPDVVATSTLVPVAQLWETAMAVVAPPAEVMPAADALPPATELASPTDAAALPVSVGSPAPAPESPPVVGPPTPAQESTVMPETVAGPARALRQVQLVLSPIDSFPHLLEIQGRIGSLSSVHALQLRDFRSGVATFVASVADTLNGREFGALLQMLATLRLRLQRATEDSAELRVEPEGP